MARIERVTIRDIPLEKSLSSRISRQNHEGKVSDRQWMLVRIGGAVLVLLALGFASNVLDPSMTGALFASSGSLNAGVIAALLGIALIVAITTSTLMSHEDG